VRRCSSSLVLLLFFSRRRRHTRSKRDWSSDVCSSDLGALRDAFGWEEDNAFVNGILTVRDVLTGIPDLITGITDILFKGDFSGMPFGLEEDSGFVNFLFNVRDAVISAGDFIKKVFDGIWQVAQITLGVIGTVILTPLILAWQALSWGIKAAWENIIKPVWD